MELSGDYFGEYFGKPICVVTFSNSILLWQQFIEHMFSLNLHKYINLPLCIELDKSIPSVLISSFNLPTLNNIFPLWYNHTLSNNDEHFFALTSHHWIGPQRPLSTSITKRYASLFILRKSVKKRMFRDLEKTFRMELCTSIFRKYLKQGLVLFWKNCAQEWISHEA